MGISELLIILIMNHCENRQHLWSNCGLFPGCTFESSSIDYITIKRFNGPSSVDQFVQECRHYLDVLKNGQHLNVQHVVLHILKLEKATPAALTMQVRQNTEAPRRTSGPLSGLFGSPPARRFTEEAEWYFLFERVGALKWTGLDLRCCLQ